MNPDLERRLRKFGSTVDAAAAAAEAERRSSIAPDATVVADLDAVVAIDARRHRLYRVLAAAAVTLAVVAGGIIVAAGRFGTSTETADQVTRPVTQAEATDAEAPTSTRATAAETSTTSAATTISAPTSSIAPPPRQGNPPVCPSYTVHNDYHLDICDRGTAVRLVQEQLQTAVDPGLDVDGYFGPRTRTAVRAFQESRGLTVDGQVGPATWKLLVPHAPGTDTDGNGFVDPSEISTG